MPFDGSAERSASVHILDAPPPDPPVETRIIDEALKILGPNGKCWIQDTEIDDDHNHCMIGAIKLARRRLGVKGDKTVRLINKVIQRYCPAGDEWWWKGSGLAHFNDKPGRTFDQVRAAFLLAKGDALSRTDCAYPAGAGAVMARLERMAKTILSGPPRDERHAEVQRRIRRKIKIMERIIEGARRRKLSDGECD